MMLHVHSGAASLATYAIIIPSLSSEARPSSQAADRQVLAQGGREAEEEVEEILQQ